MNGETSCCQINPLKNKKIRFYAIKISPASFTIVDFKTKVK